MAQEHPAIFRPFLSELFVKESDPVFNRIQKLEVLTSICTKENIQSILTEFQVYIKHANIDYVCAVIRALGRAADVDNEVAGKCTDGLLQLISFNKNPAVVQQCVIVIRQLIQQNSGTAASHKALNVLAKLMIAEEGGITDAIARANIVWLVGEYHDVIITVAPDLLQALEDEYKIVVVCLSPQSVASLAAHCEQFSCAEMFLRLAAVFKSIGVQLVIDADSANDVSLIESRNEFLERYTRGKVKQAWVQPAHSSTALSSTRLNVLAGNSSSSVGTEVEVGDVLDESQDHLQLPMLISACPGWVCFAEKTQPQVLNFVSATKSAQQILGCLLKKVFFNDITGYDAQHCASSSSSGSNVVRKELYTVSVQPCFDKKLEGSRKVRYHCLSLLRLIFIVISIFVFASGLLPR
jgi:hypothetical protein